jgi:hypothetical protein
VNARLSTMLAEQFIKLLGLLLRPVAGVVVVRVVDLRLLGRLLA